MSDTTRVLFANDGFYAAFASADFQAMTKIWVRDGSVTCIHPGCQPLIGRDAVMDSWESILSNGDPIGIQCLAPQAWVFEQAAYITCYEKFGGNALAATNIFVRDGQLWRMVHHQAGPCGQGPLTPQEEPPLKIQ